MGSTPSPEWGYSTANLSSGYLSDPDRNSTAMDDLPYWATNLVLDSVLQRDLIPPDIIVLFDLDDLDPFIDALLDQWNEVIVYSWRITMPIVIAWILALIIPILGITWCIFRCGGRCGSASKPRKEGDGLNSCILTSLFVFTMILGWLAMTWYVAAEVLGEIGAEKLPERVGYAVTDSEIYINNTVKQLTHLTTTNFNEASDNFLDEVYATGEAFGSFANNFLVDDEFKYDRMVTLVDSLTQDANEFADNKAVISQGLDAVINQLAIVDTNLQDLKTDQGLEDILDPSGPVCDALNQGQCDQVSTTLAQMTTNSATLIILSGLLNQLALPPNTLNTINTVNNELANAETHLENFETTFEEDYVLPLQEDIQEVGQDIAQETEELIQEIVKLDINTTGLVEDIDKAVDDYYVIFEYVSLVPAYVMIVVLIVWFVAVVLGSIGKVGGHNKRLGGHCLFTGSVIMFIFALVMWVMCSLLFLGGTLAESGCRTMEDPASSSLYVAIEDDLNEVIHDALDNSAFDDIYYSLPTILDECKRGDSIYKVVRLDVIFNVSDLQDWQETYGVDVALDEIRTSVSNEIDQILALTQFEPSDLTDITEFFQDAFNVVFNPIKALTLDQIFVSEALSAQLEADLKEIQTVIHDDPTLTQYGDDIDNAVGLSESLNQEVGTLDTSLSAVQTSVETYEASLYFEGMTPTEVANEAIAISEYDYDYLSTEGKAQVMDTLDDGMENAVASVDDFIDYTIHFVEADLGSCTPMYNIYFGFHNSVCNVVVMPINAIWSGMGLGLVLFFPCLLLLGGFLEPLFKRKAMAFGEESRIMAINSRINTKSNAQNPLSATNPIYEGAVQEKDNSLGAALPVAVVATGAAAQHKVYESDDPAVLTGNVKGYNPSDYHHSYAAVDEKTPPEDFHPSYAGKGQDDLQQANGAEKNASVPGVYMGRDNDDAQNPAEPAPQVNYKFSNFQDPSKESYEVPKAYLAGNGEGLSKQDYNAPPAYQGLNSS